MNNRIRQIAKAKKMVRKYYIDNCVELSILHGWELFFSVKEMEKEG